MAKSGSEGKISLVDGAAGPVSSGRGRPKGFTLIEITLVLFLLSLTVLLVLPRMEPLLQSSRKEASMRRIAGSLDGVRTRAVSTGKTLILTRDDDEDRLVVREKEGSEESLDFIEIPGEVGSFSLKPEEIRYFPQGHSSGLLITFLDEGQPGAQIEVGSFTGLSRISR